MLKFLIADLDTFFEPKDSDMLGKSGEETEAHKGGITESRMRKLLKRFEPKEFYCEKCGRMSTTKKLHYNHQRVCRNPQANRLIISNKGVYKCDVCAEWKSSLEHFK